MQLKWILGKVGLEGVDWFYLAYDRTDGVSTVMNLPVPRRTGIS